MGSPRTRTREPRTRTRVRRPDLPAVIPNALVRLQDIEAAALRLEGVAVRTPLLASPTLSRELGVEVRLKCESLQRAGSFKIRGAYNFISRLSQNELKAGTILKPPLRQHHGDSLRL